MANLKFTKNKNEENPESESDESNTLVPDLMSMLADDARMVGLY